MQYLRRPDVGRDPLRLLARRMLIEAERRVAPGRYARERFVTIDGDLVMSLRASDQIERAIYLFGLYEYASATAFSRLVRRGMTVVDAGAHSGQYTLLAAKRAGATGMVIAAEPHPGIRARLERNVRLNGLTNVRVVPVALGDRRGRTTLAIPGWAADNTGMASTRRTANAAAEIEVEADTLDAVLEGTGAGRLDVMKVDVEGAEPQLFAGGRTWIERERPAILFEANELYFGEERTDPTVRALRDFGYELFGIESLRLRKLEAGIDPRTFREYWQSLNLVALHPDRAAEFL